MKIERINLYVLELPVADPENGFTYGGGTFYKQDAVITEVICDNGLVGWGEHTTIGGVYVESCWKTTLAALEFMVPALIGQDPRAIGVINTILEKTLKGHLYAKAAIDYACWDILGKTCKMPVYQLLGGRQVQSAPMYFVVQAFPDPGQTKALFDELRGKGYTLFQIKVGDNVQKAVERVKAICPHIDPATEQVFVEEWLYCTTDLHNYNNLHIAEAGSGPIVENGRLRPAELPGLGVSPDRNKLEYPVAVFT